MTSTLTGSKRCSKCRSVKPVEDFRWRMQRGVNRPRSECRACDAEYHRKRDADPEARERDLARDRAKYHATYGVSVEIDAFVRPTVGHPEEPPPPPVTEGQLADWYRRGCPL